VFATVQGGLSRLVEAVVTELRAGPRPVEFRLGLPVRELVAGPAGGWRLGHGPASAPRWWDADAVVLALPAHRAVRLLPGPAPAAADALGAVGYASLALVTLALPPVELPELSGFLVPATEGLTVKAATFFGRKWAQHRRADGTVLVRASLGRYGEEQVLHADDGTLVTRVRAELAGLLGALPEPVATAVYRWGGALPQYTPGHVGRVAAARAVLRSVAPTVALAGAGYDGVGIPACVRSGAAAADEIAEALRPDGSARMAG
jgi:oxygen-dependent protoporphyrinogen oxidase